MADEGLVFGPSQIAAAVRTELAREDIPADKRNAFVLVVTTDGAKAVLTTKVNDVWQIDSMVSVDRGGHVEGAVAVKATW